MAKGKAELLFRSKAPWIMALLMREFPALALDDTAAIIGSISAGSRPDGFHSDRSP